MRKVVPAYESESGRKAEVYICRASAGAVLEALDSGKQSGLKLYWLTKAVFFQQFAADFYTLAMGGGQKAWKNYEQFRQ